MTIHMYTYIHTYKYTYIHIYISTYMCIHIYIYIHGCYETEIKDSRKISRWNLGSRDSWMFPYQRTPMGNPYISPIFLVCIGYNPQESLENTINTMGTLLGVHPNCPLIGRTCTVPGHFIERCGG